MVPLLLYCGWEGCGVCVEEDGMEEDKTTLRLHLWRDG